MTLEHLGPVSTGCSLVACTLVTHHTDNEPLICLVQVAVSIILYPLSITTIHYLCGASQGNKGTRHKGTAYGYRALQDNVHQFLLLSFQIMVCMGFTWTIGFVASGLDSETLWWIFVITNSLQGVLMLLTTLCSSMDQPDKKHQCKSTPQNTKVRT